MNPKMKRFSFTAIIIIILGIVIFIGFQFRGFHKPTDNLSMIPVNKTGKANNQTMSFPNPNFSTEETIQLKIEQGTRDKLVELDKKILEIIGTGKKTELLPIISELNAMNLTGKEIRNPEIYKLYDVNRKKIKLLIAKCYVENNRYDEAVAALFRNVYDLIEFDTGPKAFILDLLEKKNLLDIIINSTTLRNEEKIRSMFLIANLLDKKRVDDTGEKEETEKSDFKASSWYTSLEQHFGNEEFQSSPGSDEKYSVGATAVYAMYKLRFDYLYSDDVSMASLVPAKDGNNSIRDEQIALLIRLACYKEKKIGYRFVLYGYSGVAEAEALYRLIGIYSKRNEMQKAFDCFKAIIDKYEDSEWLGYDCSGTYGANCAKLESVEFLKYLISNSSKKSNKALANLTLLKVYLKIKNIEQAKQCQIELEKTYTFTFTDLYCDTESPQYNTLSGMIAIRDYFAESGLKKEAESAQVKVLALLKGIENWLNAKAQNTNDTDNFLMDIREAEIIEWKYEEQLPIKSK